jgi:hypothetical protein
MRSIGSFIFLFSIYSIFCLSGCGEPDPMEGWEDLNLLQYGVPFSIKAPEGAKVTTSSLGMLQDITIKNPEHNFDIQLFVADASTTNIETVVNREKAQIASDLRFIRFISQEENGFIYELEFTEEQANYDFRYVRIMGDKEYLFQTGMIGLFSQEDVEAMYRAVQ